MPLPTCQCNNGLPTQQQLGNIYCALLEIAAAGGITLPLGPGDGGTGIANPAGVVITANNDVTLLPNRVFTLALRGLVLLTAGVPADIGSVTVPAGVTAWRATRLTTRAVTAAGTLAAASISGFSQAAAAGVPFLVATTLANLTGAGQWQSSNAAVTAGAASAVTTDLTAFIRQTANSANAGTIDVFIECLDLT